MNVYLFVPSKEEALMIADRMPEHWGKFWLDHPNGKELVIPKNKCDAAVIGIDIDILGCMPQGKYTYAEADIRVNAAINAGIRRIMLLRKRSINLPPRFEGSSIIREFARSEQSYFDNGEWLWTEIATAFNSDLSQQVLLRA